MLLNNQNFPQIQINFGMMVIQYYTQGFPPIVSPSVHTLYRSGEHTLDSEVGWIGEL